MAGSIPFQPRANAGATGKTGMGPASSRQGGGLNWAALVELWQASGLKQKLLFTLVALAVFRLGAQIPVWGINPEELARFGNNQLLGFLDMFSGGALGKLSILALGIGPYITASIILQLMTVVFPQLAEMQKEEGEAGRRKMAQYTRLLTIVIALVQGALVMRVFTVNPQVLYPGVSPGVFYPMAVLALTAGAVFSLWVSEMITERGVGNGGSLLIFVGILSRIPFYAKQTAELVAGDPERSFNLALLLGIYVLTIVAIIILQEAVRKVFIVQAKRQVGNRVYGGQSNYIPFKINPAGVMPIIFAFAVLAIPQTGLQMLQQLQPHQHWLLEVSRWYGKFLSPGTAGYVFIEFATIVFFTFFYASITPSSQPTEIADNLKKYGSAMPGVKPGKPTADKLESILSRTIFIGAVGLALITLIASSATNLTGISTLAGLGSTSLIIMVGVALDTVNQIKVHLLSRNYEGFLKS